MCLYVDNGSSPINISIANTVVPSHGHIANDVSPMATDIVHTNITPQPNRSPKLSYHLWNLHPNCSIHEVADRLLRRQWYLTSRPHCQETMTNANHWHQHTRSTFVLDGAWTSRTRAWPNQAEDFKPYLGGVGDGFRGNLLSSADVGVFPGVERIRSAHVLQDIWGKKQIPISSAYRGREFMTRYMNTKCNRMGRCRSVVMSQIFARPPAAIARKAG